MIVDKLRVYAESMGDGGVSKDKAMDQIVDSLATLDSLAHEFEQNGGHAGAATVSLASRRVKSKSTVNIDECTQSIPPEKTTIEGAFTQSIELARQYLSKYSEMKMQQSDENLARAMEPLGHLQYGCREGVSWKKELAQDADIKDLVERASTNICSNESGLAAAAVAAFNALSKASSGHEQPVNSVGCCLTCNECSGWY